MADPEKAKRKRDWSRRGVPNKISLTAMADMERLGINPIECLWECFQEAMNSYKTGRGATENGDPGSQYLAVATKAASELAQYKYPKLSAVAFKEIGSDNDRQRAPLTTEQAVKILQNDPFAPKEIKDIDTNRVIDAMNCSIKNPILPIGTDDE